MKKKLLTLCLLSAALFTHAQNIGINNPNPQFPLSFNGALGDKISLWTDGAPTHYGFGVRSGLFQMFSKTAIDTIAFGYGNSTAFTQRMRIINSGEYGMELKGRMVLRNGTTPVHPDYGPGVWLSKADNSDLLGFMGTQNNQNIGFYGGPGGWGFTYDANNSRVGIGTSSPLVKLHVAQGASGNTTPLSPLVVEGNSNTYINMLSPDLNETAVLFGKASDAVSGGIVYNNPQTLNGFQFRTNSNSTKMVLDQNGNVGIGVTDPGFKLDINGRMKIRTGTDGEAGIYLNNAGNSNIAAFMGLQNDNYVGFYGAGNGWGFVMNTQTGAVKVSGSEGSAGQVIRSNGSSAPSWSSPTNSLFNNTVQVFSTAALPITADGVWTPIPDLTYTFTTTGNAKVIVMFNVHVFPGSCVNCGATSAYIAVHVNGAQGGYWTEPVGNGEFLVFSASYLAQVGPGTHTIDLRGLKFGPSAYFAHGGLTGLGERRNNMILQIIPE